MNIFTFSIILSHCNLINSNIGNLDNLLIDYVDNGSRATKRRILENMLRTCIFFRISNGLMNFNDFRLHVELFLFIYFPLNI